VKASVDVVWLSVSQFTVLVCLQCYSGRSPLKIVTAIAERPARRSVSIEMLSCCCTNNASCQPGEYFQQLTRFIPLVRCSMLNYRTTSMRCRARHQQTFIQPTLLTSTES